jgi:soluble lytic murein transglycosylase
VKRLVALGLAVTAAALLLLLSGHRFLPSWYAEALPAAVARQVYPLEHETAICETATRQRLDPALIAAVIYQESGYRETVVSKSGAIGLMQVRPQTAQEIARRTGGERFEIADLKDPTINIRYGADQLRHLLDRYDGDETAALAAYHAGLGSVDRWLAGEEESDLEPSAIAFDDTRAYVERVERLRTIYRRAYDDVLGTER